MNLLESSIYISYFLIIKEFLKFKDINDSILKSVDINNLPYLLFL